MAHQTAAGIPASFAVYRCNLIIAANCVVDEKAVFLSAESRVLLAGDNNELCGTSNPASVLCELRISAAIAALVLSSLHCCPCAVRH